jgi:hypothetical protein
MNDKEQEPFILQARAKAPEAAEHLADISSFWKWYRKSLQLSQEGIHILAIAAFQDDQYTTVQPQMFHNTCKSIENKS